MAFVCNCRYERKICKYCKSRGLNPYFKKVELDLFDGKLTSSSEIGYRGLKESERLKKASFCEICADFRNEFVYLTFGWSGSSKYIDFYLEARKKHLWTNPSMFAKMDVLIDPEFHSYVLRDMKNCACEPGELRYFQC